SNDYLFQMTISSIVVVECVKSTDSQDMIGAFVDGDLRGYTFLDQQIGNENMAFLIIYSNQVADENLTFQFYDASEDRLYSLDNQETFLSDVYIGSSTTPYLMTENFISNEISVNVPGNVVSEDIEIGELIGTISSNDANGNETYTYVLTSSSSPNINALVSIQNGNELYTEDYLEPGDWNVSISVDDGSGCIYDGLATITVGVGDFSTYPYWLITDPLRILENEPVGSQTFNLTTTNYYDEPLDNSTFDYAMAVDSDDLDNELFSANGTTLTLDQIVDYEVTDSLNILIYVTDLDDGEVYEIPHTIKVVDRNDAPTISQNVFNAPNGVSSGDVVGEFDILDQDGDDIITCILLDSPSMFELGPDCNQIIYNGNEPIGQDSEYTLTLELEDDGISPIQIVSYEIILRVGNAGSGVLSELAASNFISPNNDGFNDAWKVSDLTLISNHQLMIYDSRGNPVYEHDGSYTNGWMGTHNNGKDLPNGVYYYRLQGNSTDIVYQGSISIKR
ncbi:MAG: gliding motility-associated C-terminal domain-containing protein, partial [Saprospiraceae bacterium]